MYRATTAETGSAAGLVPRPHRNLDVWYILLIGFYAVCVLRIHQQVGKAGTICKQRTIEVCLFLREPLTHIEICANVNNWTLLYNVYDTES